MHFPGREQPRTPNVPTQADSVISEASADTVRVNAADSAADSLPGEARIHVPEDSLSGVDVLPADSLFAADSLASDSLVDSLAANSLTADSLRYDSLGRRDYGKQFLDDVISGKNQDSLVYDVRNNMIYIYTQAEISYGEQVFRNVDYMEMNMETKMISAHGVPDSTGAVSRPILVDGGKEYDMNLLNYDLNSGKAKIRGVWTTEGEGIVRGAAIKKMPDNSFNIVKGTYTTCDADHPHYYIRMTRAKILPGQKTIFGYSYLVIEDVPIPFPGLPFGFFPLNEERSSGFIMPSFGEEFVKGFYLREGGYYFAPNDYVNMTLLGGVYTKGSWEARLSSQYRKRYRYNGNFGLSFNNNKFGDQGSLDWSDEKTYRVTWTHSQDPKFKPGQTFSANVDFSSTKNNKYAANGNLNDFASNQTSSSISFSKQWAGTPFSFSMAARHSQNNRESTMSVTFPSGSLNMSQIKPFKLKNRRPGPERWYEKISTSYTNSFNNAANNVQENNMFTQAMFDRMETAMTHNIPVQANFTLLNYINLTPNFTYRENWNARKFVRNWDGAANQMAIDTVQGFHRVYDYGGSVSANTTFYGMYDNFGPRSKIQAVRHTLTPSVGISYRPGFGNPRYGFYLPQQTNANGDIGYYSPYSHMSPPGQDTQASLTFSLNQTLEAKVKTDSDSTGSRKIKIIDQLSFNFSYNFMAERFKLSPSIPVSFRSTLIRGFDLNLSTSFGMYAYEEGKMVDKLLIGQGKFPRLERLGTSFNWSKSFGKGDPNARNAGSNITDPHQAYNPLDPHNPYGPAMDNMDDEERHVHLNAYRSLLTSQYYDFTVPLNVNFSYKIDYTNSGLDKKILQTCSFGASMNLTPQWGLSLTSGYDFQARRIVDMTSFTLTRDLHCMQMNFNWIPMGRMKSWNFHISVKANVLRDLKYEKSGSRFDDLY